MTQIVMPQYKNCHAMKTKFGQVTHPIQFARFLCRAAPIFFNWLSGHPVQNGFETTPGRPIRWQVTKPSRLL